MKKNQELPQISAKLKDQVQDLQYLAGQVSRLGSQIMEITGKLSKIDQDLRNVDTVDLSPGEPHVISAPNTTIIRSSKIIPFRNPNVKDVSQEFVMDRFLPDIPFLAMPDMPLPAGIFDYRSLLQRDGLILLSWDKRICERGEHYTAYWITSSGTPRFYASKPHSSEDFFLALPHHKSYAAEDGIEFYGQKAPAYIVHVAPELMMTNPRHRELRHSHIKKLKELGSRIDFGYKYLLTKEKNRNMRSRKQKNFRNQQAGA